MFSSGEAGNPTIRVSANDFDPMNFLEFGDLGFGQGTENVSQFQEWWSYPEAGNLPNVNHGQRLGGVETTAPPDMGAADVSVGSPEIYPDVALSFINHILMEEDLDEQVYIPSEDPALIAAEKAFHDVLDEYNASRDPSAVSADDGLKNSDFDNKGDLRSFDNEIHSQEMIGNGRDPDFAESHYSHMQSVSVDHASPSSFGSFASVSNDKEGTDGCQLSGASVSDMYFDSRSIYQFNKGMQEARKFLPGNGRVVVDSQNNDISHSQSIAACEEFSVSNVVEELSHSSDHTGRKNSRSGDLNLEEGRSSKMASVSYADVLSGMFEEMLHLCIDANGCGDGSSTSLLSQPVHKQVKNKTKNNPSKKSSSGKSQGRKQITMEVIDLGNLLLQCSQSVAACDHRSVNEQLQVIRQHSLLSGSGSQRLAHCFADGLEARFAGIGSQIYQSRLARRSATTSEILKAYHLYMRVCPFRRISHFFANQSIINVANGVDKIHIVDFGIGFGFQWPCLFRRLSRKKGGSPRIRITAIDLPQPGFRPSERLEETGRRLAVCAQSFNIPFEYRAVASKWENIHVGDLNVEDGEVLIVNCLYVLRSLADETVIVESPRSIVLNNIRAMSPDLFVTGVMSSACGSPFFSTRFREALFYYSALFDVLETNAARDDPQRQLIEQEIFGREAINIIACEGSDRVYRPETYKQWRGRYQNAGFKQLTLNSDILYIARHSVLSCYNKNFIVEEDNEWMLLGWKGRVLYALSTWKPMNSSA